MKIRSLGLKLSIIVALTIAVIIAVNFYIVSIQSSRLIADLSEKEAEAANTLFVKEVHRLQNEALSSARIIAYAPDVVNSILNKNDAMLKQALINYGATLDTVMVVDTKGTVLMRKHSDQKGDNVLNQTIVKSVQGFGL